MPKIPIQYVKCKRCGRKIPDGRQSEYCSNKCRNSATIVKQLSAELIKEIYLLVSNKGLFSDEEIGMKLRSKEFTEKFSQVLFVQDENEGDIKCQKY
jgi:predicted nucleic acid-binding Zn ribbon protein